MRYRIAIHRSDEGYSISVPGLPGCWSQGVTEPEALANIRDAIREYLMVVEEHRHSIGTPAPGVTPVTSYETRRIDSDYFMEG